MNPYYLTLMLYIFLIYWFIVVALDRKGILERYNISTIGPILMIKTKRGGRLLERLSNGASRERFWRIYANIGTVLVLVAMAFMFILVIYGTYATFMVHPEPSKVNEPRNWLLIPGLNEFIPMCAWVGFVIALVVHELSHAVLGTVEKIKVKSMGLLVALVPIGAFAELDSEQLFGEKEKKSGEEKIEATGAIDAEEPGKVRRKVATSRERTRILSAGVTSNFCVAFVAFLLFFAILFSVQPVSDNVLYVYNVADGSPAECFGMGAGMFITAVDGSPVTRVEELNAALEGKEESVVTVLDKRGTERALVMHRGSESTGVTLLWVEKGLPAAKAGLTEGMRITRMDTTSINSYDDFHAFMDRTKPAQIIEVQTDEKAVSIELADSPFADIGYLGVLVANNPLGMFVVDFSAQEYLGGLRSIPSSFTSFSPPRWLNSWLWLTAMPIAPLLAGGFGGFNPILSHLYEPVGVASLFGGGIFWIADVLFWIGWINFYVGLFNCLPAIPLDGGYVFREMLNPVLRLGIKDEGKKEKISKVITATIAIFIASSIVFMLAAPYVL
ncbi:peptidase [ANME-1 cluster archaeon GoMg4]|nr:peptidase [ANME-1 cluster archaeon GoMg4]